MQHQGSCGMSVPAPGKTRAETLQNAWFMKTCDICGLEFKSRSRFSRFCVFCKTEDENYRFAEWLPRGTVIENS